MRVWLSSIVRFRWSFRYIVNATRFNLASCVPNPLHLRHELLSGRLSVCKLHEAGRSRKINIQRNRSLEWAGGGGGIWSRRRMSVSGCSKSVLARNSRRRFVNSAKLFLLTRAAVRRIRGLKSGDASRGGWQRSEELKDITWYVQQKFSVRYAEWTLLNSCLVLEIYIRLVGVYAAIFRFASSTPSFPPYPCYPVRFLLVRTYFPALENSRWVYSGQLMPFAIAFSLSLCVYLFLPFPVSSLPSLLLSLSLSLSSISLPLDTRSLVWKVAGPTRKYACKTTIRCFLHMRV